MFSVHSRLFRSKVLLKYPRSIEFVRQSLLYPNFTFNPSNRSRVPSKRGKIRQRRPQPNPTRSDTSLLPRNELMTISFTNQARNLHLRRQTVISTNRHVVTGLLAFQTRQTFKYTILPTTMRHSRLTRRGLFLHTLFHGIFQNDLFRIFLRVRRGGQRGTNIIQFSIN